MSFHDPRAKRDKELSSRYGKVFKDITVVMLLPPESAPTLWPPSPSRPGGLCTDGGREKGFVLVMAK